MSSYKFCEIFQNGLFAGNTSAQLLLFIEQIQSIEKVQSIGDEIFFTSWHFFFFNF